MFDFHSLLLSVLSTSHLSALRSGMSISAPGFAIIYEGAPRVKEKVWLVIFHFQLHFEHPDGGQGNAGERPERRSGGRDWCGGEDSRPTESKKSKNPILAGKR